MGREMSDGLETPTEFFRLHKYLPYSTTFQTSEVSEDDIGSKIALTTHIFTGKGVLEKPPRSGDRFCRSKCLPGPEFRHRTAVGETAEV